MVADHQHIEMFIDGVEGVGQRWVGGRRQNVRVGAGGDDVRRMAAAGPFGMEGVDGAPADGGEGVFHKTGFIQGVAVQGDWMSISSATVNAQSIAAGVAPQSSWIFRPITPAATCSRRASG